uniref:Uncharacterized protein n=1 Tax=Geladintestivirus 6 TaxID=3233138 RepID=A0AAU8MHM1_9CAUD
MKTNRIFPYCKTAGERRHEAQVKQVKANKFKHPGSKSGHILHAIVKNNLRNTNI